MPSIETDKTDIGSAFHQEEKERINAYWGWESLWISHITNKFTLIKKYFV